MLTRQRKNVLWKEELNLLQDIKVFDKEPKYCQTKIANADPCHNFDFSLFSFFNCSCHCIFVLSWPCRLVERTLRLKSQFKWWSIGFGDILDHSDHSDQTTALGYLPVYDLKKLRNILEYHEITILPYEYKYNDYNITIKVSQYCLFLASFGKPP